MRLTGVAFSASVLFLMACGGGERPADTTATAAGSTAGTATTTTGGTATAGGTATGTAAPISGTVHEVKMLGDATGYRFEPANLTIKAGDGVKWVMVSGGPHNVAFQNVPASAKSQLVANMPDQSSGELSSKMYMNANEGFTMSFANVPGGKYDYVCTPHLAMGMRGSITIQ